MPRTATAHRQTTAAVVRDRRAVLAKAVIAAADRLGIRQTALAKIIGVSAPTISRMAQAQYGLDPDSKPGELALLFVRLYRSLDAIVGTDEAARRWLDSQNHALNGRPAELIRGATGLVDVVAYLDSQRARL